MTSQVDVPHSWPDSCPGSRKSGNTQVWLRNARKWVAKVWTYQNLVMKIWTWVAKIWTRFPRPMARLMSRLSRPYVQTFPTQILGATMQFGLNPDAVRPLARLMSRLFRFYAQTFQSQILGAAIQFGSASGCSATRGAQDGDGATFQTKAETA